MGDCIRIFEINSADVSYVDAVNRLLVQLSTKPAVFTLESLEEIVSKA